MHDWIDLLPKYDEIKKQTDRQEIEKCFIYTCLGMTVLELLSHWRKKY